MHETCFLETQSVGEFVETQGREGRDVNYLSVVDYFPRAESRDCYGDVVDRVVDIAIIMGSGGSVKYIVFTLLYHMHPRMADRAVWTMRAFHGQVAGVGACRTKESLPKLGFFLGW